MALLRPQPGAFYREQVSRLISWGHWFTFFNILLALGISSRYILANPWPETQLGVSYLILSWLGHFSFIGFITSIFKKFVPFLIS
jgi:membrane-anchored protein YejM (alkaline phosphatase superfamily)